MKRHRPTRVDSLRVRACALALCCAASVAAADDESDDLAGLALEDLLQIKVTTAARKPQSLHSTPAAVFVISREDIERSGAASVPEALQMAPGVQVGRISSGSWAISLRGANSRFADKLQVLVDGRSVYTPLFSGTVWEDRELMLEDVERIEVVRGPGGALWGSNAMNGVINIITRRAQDTQGTLVSAAAGTEQRGWLAVRHGFSVGDSHSGRIWAKRRLSDASDRPDGAAGYDDGRNTAGGVLWESRLGGGHTFTLQAGASSTRHGEELDLTRYTFGGAPIPGRLDSQENHLLMRYAGIADSGADYSLQASYAHSSFAVDNAVGPIDDARNTLDIDFQRREPRGGRHDVIWGASYRHTSDQLNVQLIGGFIRPPSRSTTWTSVFVQDDITLLPERLHLVLGARVEESNLDKPEVQPTARLMFTPDGPHSFWAAASRTTRQPSRALRDFNAELGPFPQPPLAGGFRIRSAGGGRDMRSETATSLELGYRYRSGPLTVDVAAFATRYRHQAEYVNVFNGVVALPDPTLLAEFEVRATDDSRAHGLELAADYRPGPDWSLHGAYTYTDSTALDRTFRADIPLTNFFIYSADARHRLSLRSLWNLTPRLKFDAWLRHTSRVEPVGIPSFSDLDLRLAWTPRRGFELSLVGQNLLHARRVHYAADTLPSSSLAIERGAYVKAVWSF